MVERWHLELAATALVVGLAIAVADRWAGARAARHAVGVAGLMGAVLGVVPGSWSDPRMWPWLIAAAVPALWPDDVSTRPPVIAHPLGEWTVALTVVSLVGVWSAVPDTEPPLAAGCALAALGLGRVVASRSVGRPGTAALVVAVAGATWAGSAGRGAAMASACAVGMVLCGPVAAGFTDGGIRRAGRRVLIGAHLVVALVVPRTVMRLDAGEASGVAASVMAALLVLARAVVVHDRHAGGRTGSLA